MESLEPTTEREMLLLLGQSMGKMAGDVQRLADHVAVQNGRVGKLEGQRVEQLAYDAGRASLRRSDLALLAGISAVVSAIVGIGTPIIKLFFFT